MASHNASKVGAVCAVGGSVLLLIGTALHPMQADPDDSIAAFTEYAADQLWVASHLTQLAGIALMDAALVILTQQLQMGEGKTLSYFAVGSAVAGAAVAAALQAVDGIALKSMVNWAYLTTLDSVFPVGRRASPFKTAYGSAGCSKSA